MPGFLKNNLDTNAFHTQTLWLWLPPIISMVALGLILSLNMNTRLFYTLNPISQYTGQALWQYLTVLGDSLVLVAVAAPFIRKYPDIIWSLILSSIVATIVTQGLKNGLGVKRPPAILDAESFTLMGPKLKRGSFPSGHTTSVFMVAGVLILSLKHRWLKVALFGLAMLVGLSRNVVGVHWPADIAAGVLCGWLSAICGLWLRKKLPRGEKHYGRHILAVLILLSLFVLFTVYPCHYPQATMFQRIIGLAAFIAGLYGYGRLLSDKQ